MDTIASRLEMDAYDSTPDLPMRSLLRVVLCQACRAEVFHSSFESRSRDSIGSFRKQLLGASLNVISEGRIRSSGPIAQPFAFQLPEDRPIQSVPLRIPTSDIWLFGMRRRLAGGARR